MFTVLMPYILDRMSTEDMLEKQNMVIAVVERALPGLGMPLVVASVAGCFVVGMAVDHVVTQVVAKLAIAESPTKSDIIDEKRQLKGAFPDTTTSAPPKPLTSSIRATIKHLTALGGWRACWRDVPSALLHAAAYTGMSAILLLGLRLHATIATFLALQLTAPLHCRVTYQILSKPGSPRPPFISRSQWMQLLLPNVLSTVAGTLNSLILSAVASFSQQQAHSRLAGDSLSMIWASALALAPLVAMLAGWALIDVPTDVIETRIVASFIPTDVETTVPINRNSVRHSSDAIGLGAVWDAVKSFTGTRRLLKIYLKSLVVDAVLYTVFGSMLFLEFRMTTGRNLLDFYR